MVQTESWNLYWQFGLLIVAHLDDWLLFASGKHCSLCHETAVHHHSSAHHIFDLPRTTYRCAMTHYSVHNAMPSEATYSAHLGVQNTCSELATNSWICQPAHLNHEVAIFYDSYTLCMRSILDQTFRWTGHALYSTSDHITTHSITVKF